MKLTFLEAHVPLTKKFTKRSDGSIEKHSYPFVKKFTSITAEVKDIHELSSSMKAQASKGRCLLKGNVKSPLVKEGRSGSTDPQQIAEWVVFDVDGMENISSAKEFVEQVLPSEFWNTTYLVQHSASAGISGDGFRAHIFFILSHGCSPTQIKAWLQYKNLTTAMLIDEIDLSKNAITLCYPLDITVCQSDKLIYIAPPTCEGFDDPLAEERIVVVEHDKSAVQYDFPAPSSAQLRHLETEQVNTLRSALGLRKKERKMVVDKHGIEYLDSKSLDVSCLVTGAKLNSAGLVQLNLDGGDSWGYFYDPQYPKYLKNFKGEPITILKDHLPDFYREVILKDQAERKKDLPNPFIFRDYITDAFFAGLRDKDGKVTQCDMIGKNNVDDFFMQYQTSPPSPLPTWERFFNPTVSLQYDEARKRFNDWQPTEYMENATARTEIPPTVDKILTHVTGDAESRGRFINWLAFIYQNRTKPGTAWVLHGCPGTGKGVLFNNIIKPIFGDRHCATKLIADLGSNFNSFLETALFCNVDETRASDAGHEAKRVINTVKNWITEPTISIEAKFQNARISPSFVSFIFTTNDLDALPIQEGDRRFNVAPRQEIPIVLSPKEIENDIPGELLQFAGYLKAYKVNQAHARNPMANRAKSDLRLATQTSIDEFCNAVRHGDLQYFIDGVDEPSTLYEEKARFREAVEQWIEDAREGTASAMTAAQLRDAFNVMLLEKGMKTGKFRSMMLKRGLPERNRRDGDLRWRGWQCVWNIDMDLARELKLHIKAVPDPEKVVKAELED